ncbi:serine protease inhibitor [Acrasis kona]|uniref:Serine protease inhibitor n=1 Tax=Acrasis kona TaxID=1008807 RepID=A0AAW2ZD56_9EUKA
MYSRTLFLSLLFVAFLCFAQAQTEDELESIVAVRDVDEWLSGSYVSNNKTCCNVCPEPKIHIIKHWTTKQININIPVPVLKPHKTQTSKDCPQGYTKIAPNKCYREVVVTERQPCAEGYSRIADNKCVKLIIIENVKIIDRTLVVCPPGFKKITKKNVTSCRKGKIVIVPPTPEVPPIKCPKGYVAENSETCIKVIECPKKRGWIKLPDGSCARNIFKCPVGYKKLGQSRCIHHETECPQGYKESKDHTECIKEYEHPPIDCKKGFIQVGARCVSDKCTKVKCANPKCEPGYSLQKGVPSDCCATCQPCACSAVIHPVCGKDGVTYVNQCAASCLKVEIKHKGVCTRKDIPHTFYTKKCSKCSKCSDKYKPVCSSDGVTYQNKCVARCANASVIGEGTCEDVCVEDVDVVEIQFKKWINKHGVPKDVKELVNQVKTSPELIRLSQYVKVAIK